MSLRCKLFTAAQSKLMLMVFLLFGPTRLLVFLLHQQKLIDLPLVQILTQGALSLCDLNLKTFRTSRPHIQASQSLHSFLLILLSLTNLFSPCIPTIALKLYFCF